MYDYYPDDFDTHPQCEELYDEERCVLFVPDFMHTFMNQLSENDDAIAEVSDNEQ